MNIKNLTNKRIAVLGMGVNNQALLKWLIKHGVKDVTICDKNKNIVRACREHIRNTQCRLLHRTSFESKHKIFKFQTGEKYLDNLEKFDVVFRTPGIPYYHSKIQEALKKGVEISSQTKLFFDLCPAKIIGITGTKGKGTTAVLIHKILQLASRRCHSEPIRQSQGKLRREIPFKSDFSTEFHSSRNDKCLKHNIYLAGNIGKDPFEFLDKLTKKDWVILELSSFQLQDLRESPHIAVVLNITSDHLDYHKNTKEYRDAKLNIVRHQKKNDYAVINLDYLTSFKFAIASPTVNDYYFSTRKSVDLGAFVLREKIVLRVSERDSSTEFTLSKVERARNDNIQEYEICKIKDIKLLGPHNLENICAAITASYLVGADLESIKKTITTFPGREHRLEFVREYKGVKFYNDSASTNPDTAIAAIKSFSSPIILIAGGSDKGADYSELGKEISLAKNIKKVVLVGKTAKKIEAGITNYELRIKNRTKIEKYQTFDKAVQSAIKLAKSGDVVLLSPASASFDSFKNYEERGEIFKKSINNFK